MTRYPKQGKNRRWTVVELKAIPPEWRGDTLADGDGLSGEVRVASDGAISVRWKYAFRWESKVAWFQAGTWPATSLETIRERRDDARGLVKEGINPNTHKQASRVEAQRKAETVIKEEAERRTADASVQDMFDEWIQHGVRRGDGNAALRRSFEKDVLPKIGQTPVSQVSERQLRDLLLSLVDRGVNRTADVTCSNIQQMFRWAEKRSPWRRLLADGNPADLLEIEKIVSDDYDLAGVRQRKLSPDELKQLASVFADLESIYDHAPAGGKYAVARPVKKTTQLALWICLSTLSRIGETVRAEWKHVNLDTRTWTIPAENTKTKQAIEVSLSGFAARQFEALRELTGSTQWLFPARDGKTHIDEKTITKQIGDRQLRFMKRKRPLGRRREDDSLVLADGANGEWGPHDLRRTGATMMEALKVPPHVIDRCQNHTLGGGLVRKTYQQHHYTDEMKDAWTVLGGQLDSIMAQLVDERERAHMPAIHGSLRQRQA